MTKGFLMALCLSLAGAVGISWALVLPAAADAGTGRPAPGVRAAAAVSSLRVMPLGGDRPTTDGYTLDFVGTWVVAGAPDTTVLVGSLVVSTSSTVEANRAEYNRQIPGIVQARQAAGKHVRYVDMGALNAADLADSPHPNDTGYRKMADAFYSGIRAADEAGWLGEPVATGGQVRSEIAGKCMDVDAGGTANGTPVQSWSCTTSGAQRWTARSDGSLRVLGKCLDALGRGTANGTQLAVWDCNGGANQVWQAYDGGYRNPVSGRCVDLPASSAADGTRLVLWDCNGGPNQKWTTLLPV